MLKFVILLSRIQSQDLHYHNPYICIMPAHFFFSLSNNVIIKLDAIDILHFFIVIPCEVGVGECLRSIGGKFLIGKSRNVPLVEIGTLDIDIREGIDRGIRDECVRDGSHSKFDIFVEGSMRAIWVGPL